MIVDIVRIIPAYAGSTPPTESTAYGFHGSSPHTRGAPPCFFRRLSFCRIIPAYAGSTARPDRRRVCRRDHPRIRGEHARPAARCVDHLGSSPHTRGAHRHRPARRHGDGIIPAYAGSTSGVKSSSSLSSDHPRIRGEHAQIPAGQGMAIGSSPHTRGAHSARGSAWGSGRIIPAYAGSTNSSASPGTAKTDHPRIRGEHS